jgi:hypothetical protein
MIVSSAAIYRAYWLILPDWISLLLVACFLLAAATTLFVLVLAAVSFVIGTV